MKTNIATVKPEILTDDSVVYNVWHNGEQVANPPTRDEAEAICESINRRRITLTDEQIDEPICFRIHYQKQGDVARALVGAGFGWLTDNGNVFKTRSSFAAEVFDNAMVERDSDPNRVRRFVGMGD